jgi:hypothetical protein
MNQVRYLSGKTEMGKFNSKISAEFHPPKKWILERALSYQNDDINEEHLKAVGINVTSSGKISCKKGFVTDLASVPRAIWAFISPWDIARAAIIHDLLYKRIRQWRHEGGTDKKTIKDAKRAADNVFLMAMKDAEPSVPEWKVYAAHRAVVLFGRWSIIPSEDNI